MTVAPRPVGLLVSATLLAGALAAAVQWPVAAVEPLFAAGNVLVIVGFFVCGLVLGRSPGQAGTALALVLLAVFSAVGWLNWWEAGPLPLAAEVLGPLAPAFGAWALLRYPDPRLCGRVERAFVVAAFALLPGAQALLVPISLPAWHGFGAAVWWPAPWPMADLYAAGHRAYEAVVATLAAAFIVLVLARLAGRGGLDRRLSAPVSAASVAGAIAVSIQAAGLWAGLPRPAMHAVFTVSASILLLIPLGFLAAAVRRRLARSAVADLVVRLARSGPGLAAPEAVRTALREVLCDPTLDVVSAAPADGAAADRLAVPVSTGHGEAMAVVLTDPSLARHRDLLDAALAACGLAMHRARLQTALTEHRRELERDLHDGAQQRLLALAARIAVARLGAPDERTAAAMDEAGRELRTAIGELRRLARGVHPGVLVESGLAAAVEDVAEGVTVPVHLELAVGRLEPHVESAAYFVVCEALANAVKHAAASRVRVRGQVAAGVLAVEIDDDGAGGARPTPGGGLRGLADRVGALGGRLTVVSPPGGGTRVEVRLPCG